VFFELHISLLWSENVLWVLCFYKHLAALRPGRLGARWGCAAPFGRALGCGPAVLRHLLRKLLEQDTDIFKTFFCTVFL